MPFRPILLLAVCAPLLAAAALADAPPASETMAEHRLKDIAEHQRVLFADAVAQGRNMEDALFKTGVEQLTHEYESLVRDNPGFAAGYAAYGYMLWKVGLRKEAVANLSRANDLDPEIPLVKNELGNYFAEEGQPLEAVNYYQSAIKLEPGEPLYHYQLGSLLYASRDDFIRHGGWTRAAVDHSMQEAFKSAADLAPGRIEFSYRYAESFYDMEDPDWAAALRAWEGLEARAQSEIERQTMRLHEANVLLSMGDPGQARRVLAAVTDPALEAQKQKLVARLPADAGK
jgi:tetratricopeptide (TPR) repeat protein